MLSNTCRSAQELTHRAEVLAIQRVEAAVVSEKSNKIVFWSKTREGSHILKQTSVNKYYQWIIKYSSSNDKFETNIK